MTTFLYILFYGWLIGVILFGILMIASVKIIGGREEATKVTNLLQGRNYQTHHLEWALVISVVFWPHTIAATILNSVTARSVEKAKQEPSDASHNPPS